MRLSWAQLACRDTTCRQRINRLLDLSLKTSTMCVLLVSSYVRARGCSGGNRFPRVLILCVFKKKGTHKDLKITKFYKPNLVAQIP